MTDDKYTRGDIIKIYSSDAAEHVLTVTAPDGIKVIFPLGRVASLWLPQVGTWTYAWDNGEGGTIEVADVYRPTTATKPPNLPPMVLTTSPER